MSIKNGTSCSLTFRVMIGSLVTSEICTGDTEEGGHGIPIVDYSVVGTTPGLSQEAVGAIHIVDHSLVESGKSQVEAVQCMLVFHLYHLGSSLCQHSFSIDLSLSAARVAAAAEQLGLQLLVFPLSSWASWAFLSCVSSPVFLALSSVFIFFQALQRCLMWSSLLGPSNLSVVSPCHSVFILSI